MSRTIWKYELVLTDEQGVEMPEGAEIVHFGYDPLGHLAVWVRVDPEVGPETRTIYLRGTGHPLPEDGRYIGSAVRGPFVWHALVKDGGASGV